MREQAEHVGTQIVSDIIASVDLSRRPFIAIGESGAEYEADTLVIADANRAVGFLLRVRIGEEFAKLLEKVAEIQKVDRRNADGLQGHRRRHRGAS